MQIKKGQDRVVFVFPSLKIVIKLPIIHLILAFYPELLRVAFRKSIRTGLKYTREYFLMRRPSPFWRALFKGLHDNWGEFCFYQKTKNVFLQPSYFSFFGFLNIQLYGELYPKKDEDIWRQLCVITNDGTMNNPHHFRKSCNFCFYKGRLRILDYGDNKTQKVISRYGVKIFNEFTLDWDIQKTKERTLA